ncbi:hypothetical protein ASD67_18970 [Sphingopyxis sp. Root1497]|uniref:hypothetical protein n=1 Tax=Sphingopyxis sp. Root1497 TaxID=1736474 RepID=UPI0006F79B4A|nr:hypothetical protein [Sphingopyxis sp. Root1497]KQZ61322.1 hypothetical protein ASD67_18970 [Sphingopyxis sp. Root1497]
MSLFPRIQSPCPYKGKLSDIMDGDTCRLCHREVHDISDLSSAARQALVAGCSDEICVSYKVPVKSALAAMALGASMATPAYAQIDEVLAVDGEPTSGEYCLEDNYIIVGGLKKPGEVEWLTADLDSSLPDMPVVYDDEPAPVAKATPASAPVDAPTDAKARDDRDPPPLVKDRPAAS